LKESKKLDHLMFFFFNFTHKGRKYLTIIEHIFHFIIPFSCQNLSSNHAFVLHTNGLQVEVDYIPELGFSSQDFVSKYHNLYSTTPCLMRPIFRTPFNGRYRQVWLYIDKKFWSNISKVLAVTLTSKVLWQLDVFWCMLY
jgi:hypothetical protein